MWPVETSSAKKLTTSIFQHLKENVGIDKAQAHQMAMIELIEGPGLLDKDGRIIASYAHPLFWAPFIIVGDHVSANRN
jgi:CHAT domain-containing protein